MRRLTQPFAQAIVGGRLSADLDKPTPPPADDHVPSEFFVVGIGASAGGLESLEKLFSSLPADTGMAFVVLQHL